MTTLATGELDAVDKSTVVGCYRSRLILRPLKSSGDVVYRHIRGDFNLKNISTRFSIHPQAATFEFLTLNDRVNHFTLHIGQAEVTARVAESQTLVIDPQKVQHGGVEIVSMNCVVGCQNAVFIRLAINDAAFDATSGHP